jgi:hypothetical protein
MNCKGAAESKVTLDKYELKRMEELGKVLEKKPGAMVIFAYVSWDDEDDLKQGPRDAYIWVLPSGYTLDQFIARYKDNLEDLEDFMGPNGEWEEDKNNDYTYIPYGLPLNGILPFTPLVTVRIMQVIHHEALNNLVLGIHSIR